MPSETDLKCLFLCFDLFCFVLGARNNGSWFHKKHWMRVTIAADDRIGHELAGDGAQHRVRGLCCGVGGDEKVKGERIKRIDKSEANVGREVLTKGSEIS